MPPLIAATHLGSETIAKLRSALLQPDQTLQTAMAIAGVKRYDHQTWQDYKILAALLNMGMIRPPQPPNSGGSKNLKVPQNWGI